MTRPSRSPRRTGPSHFPRPAPAGDFGPLRAAAVIERHAARDGLHAPGKTPPRRLNPTRNRLFAPVVVVTPRPAPVGSDLLGLTIIILGFTIGAVVAALLYSYNIQMKYYDAATSLGVSGVPVKTTSESTFAAVPSGGDKTMTGPARRRSGHHWACARECGRPVG